MPGLRRRQGRLLPRGVNIPMTPVRFSDGGRSAVAGKQIMEYAYRVIAAKRQIGICRAVKAQGWLDALPPAFTRGVVPVRTLVPGGVRHPHPFHKKCEEWNCKHRKINYLTLSEIRTPPVPALAQGHPPHKCGGQGRVPHPPAHHSTNSSTNSNLSRHRTIPSGSGRKRK